MKACATCGQEKEEEQFYWRYKDKGIRWGTCKTCQKKQKKRWYEKHGKAHREKVNERQRDLVAKNRKFIWNYLLRHPCVDCGESNPIVLEFDHVRGEKRDSISRLIGDKYSLKVIMEEVDKCVVRCANCHRIKTAERGNWFNE